MLKVHLILYEPRNEKCLICCFTPTVNSLNEPPEAVYQYSVPILSPVTDNLLFLNQPEEGINFNERCRSAVSCTKLGDKRADDHRLYFRFKDSTIHLHP